MNRALAALLVLALAPFAAAQGDSATKVRLKRAILEKDAVVLDLRVEAGWHIYAVTSEFDQGNATKVAIDKPHEIAGPVAEPKPHHVKKDYKDQDTGEVIYTEEYDSHEGEITLRIPVRGGGGAAVKGSLGVTACDANKCLPPGTLRFVAEPSNGSGGGATPADPGPAAVEGAATKTTASRPARKVVTNPTRLGSLVPDDPFKVVEISYPDPITTDRFEVAIVVEVASGYHVYGLSKETTGVPTSFRFPKPDERNLAAVFVGSDDVVADPAPKRREKQFEKYDYFDHKVTFRVPVRAMWLPEGNADRTADVSFPVRLAIDYQTCTWDFCLPPGSAEYELTATVTGGPHVLPVLTPDLRPTPKVAEVPAVDARLTFEPATLEPNESATMVVRLKRRDGKPIAVEGREPRIELAQARYITPGLAAVTAEPDGTVTIRLPIEVSPDAPDTTIDVGGRAAIGDLSAGFEGQVTIVAPLLGFLIIAALSALGALLTPCVFPMIPVTVSIFTKQAEAGAQHPARLGLLYCVGIVASFTAIGAIFTAALPGGDGANVFAQHWVTQLVIAALFVFFALSLLGMFDLAVPQPIMNLVERTTTRRLTTASEGKGASLTVLFMGLLFAVTTFTCTAPFIGGLLAGASASGWSKPVFGMLAFSTVLAVPFFFLAVFPSQLKKLPKSGGWLNETKVVMGFIELAAAVKFLNGADLSLGWEVFTRNVCLAMWIAIFGLTGIYLLGVFRLPKDTPRQKTGVIPLLVAGAFLTLAVYLSTGLNGKPLGKFIEGWLPPVEEVYAAQMELAARGGDCAEGRLGYGSRFKDDFEAALTEARSLDVPLFIDFTGFT